MTGPVPSVQVCGLKDDIRDLIGIGVIQHAVYDYLV